jgi:hypothetical protein
LLGKILLKGPRAIIDTLELVFQATSLRIDFSRFPSDIRFALCNLVAILLKRSDTRSQRALNALPVLRSDSVLCLQSLNLAEQFGLRVACCGGRNFFRAAAKEL